MTLLSLSAPDCEQGQFFKLGQGCSDCGEGFYSRGGYTTQCIPCPDEGDCEDIMRTTAPDSFTRTPPSGKDGFKGVQRWQIDVNDRTTFAALTLSVTIS